MNAKLENKNKLIALGITIGLHILLLILCVSIVFITPIPAFEIKEVPEIELALGFEGRGSMDSGGSGTPEEGMENPENITPPNPTINSNPANVITDNTNNNDAATVITNTNPGTSETETTLTNPTVETAEPQQISSPLAELLKKAKERRNAKAGTGGGNTGGHGTGTGQGGTGSDSGTGHGDGRPGGNGGNGNYNLAGRRLLKSPEQMTDTQEEGIVVVEIIVNSEGKVIKATPGKRGSTTNSAHLLAKARQAAFSAKFDPSTSGVKEQRGTYTFVFLLE